MCEKWRLKNETECCHCYGPSNIRRLCCPREFNKKTTVQPLFHRLWAKPQHFDHEGLISCFLSNLYNLSCSRSPYPFENIVASDHTFVKKNRVVWHWGACHLRSCRLFNVHDWYINRSHFWLSCSSSCWAWLQ